MVRQWQEMFCERRYSSTVWEFTPDFCKIAEGYDIPSFRVTDARDVRTAIDRALHTPGPMLVDFMVVQEENVLPMIPAGRGQIDFVGEGDE
jgi:acetolactate synthase-1/2/3 large subunit